VKRAPSRINPVFVFAFKPGFKPAVKQTFLSVVPPRSLPILGHDQASRAISEKGDTDILVCFAGLNDSEVQTGMSVSLSNLGHDQASRAISEKGDTDIPVCSAGLNASEVQTGMSASLSILGHDQASRAISEMVVQTFLSVLLG